MIYSVSANNQNLESQNMSPIDVIMDIYESALEYNETSYIHEGITDFIRNLGTKIVNVINKLIIKIKTLIKDAAYRDLLKNIQKARSNPDKVNISESDPLKFPTFGTYEQNYEKFEQFMKKNLEAVINAEAVSEYKQGMSGSIKLITVYRITSISDLENSVKKANSKMTEHINYLERVKKKALSELKTAKDVNLASRYASLVVWSANRITNELLQTMMKAIKITNARLKGKNKDSELYLTAKKK